MTLRRVALRLRQLNWEAVSVDLIVVIVGVFIGIQASNWNQSRTDAVAGAVFAERLKADLREEDWGYQLLIAYNGEVLANAERAADALDGSAALPDEALLVAAYRATQYKQRLRRRTTYDELISTGKIALIGDQTLRDAAMRIYSVPTIDNLVREGMQSRYREAFRMSLPNAVQRALAKQCGDRYTKTGDYAALRGSLEDLPTIRVAFDGAGAPPPYELVGARALDLSALVYVSDRSPGFGLGGHAFAGGGIGRVRNGTRDGDRYFFEGGGGVSSGPFGVELSVKFAFNRFDEPVRHQIITVPVTVRGTVSF